MALPLGTILDGKFKIVQVLGEGGMGTVYKACDTRLNNRPMAVKEMSRAGLSPAQIQEAEASFEREAQILANLSHPNLPHIYDHFTKDERSYLVMDFIEGQTLEDYLEKAKGSPLPLNQVLEWGRQLCDVLDYLHTRQPPVVFRDLKPSNVMIKEEGGRIFLIDFGIARIFKPGKSHDTVALGSPGFAAPEQYGKAQSSPRSDIYSLGALLHNLLTGVDPSEQPFFFRPSSQLNPIVPPALEQLLQQMLEMQTEKRPGSIQEVLNVLHQVEAQPANNTYSQPLPTVLASRPGQGTIVGAETLSSANAIGTVGTGGTRTSPGNALLQDAHRLYNMNRLPDALQLFDRALQTENHNPLAWQGRGLVQAQRGQHADALASFERALKLNPNLVTSLNGKGTALNILRRNEDALKAFDRAILLEKDNVIAWNGKGAALSARRLHEQAVTAFEVALHFDPRMSQAWGNKGWALRHMHRYKEALRAFEEALALDPRAVNFWNGKGMILSELGRPNESLQAYQEALKIDSTSAPALCGIGDFYYSQQNLQAAYGQYEKALQSNPQYVKAWEKRAIVLMDIGNYPKALESFDKALHFDPRYASAWNGKANVLCNMEQYQQALDAYNQALLYNANAAQAWNGRGNALYHLGDYRSALNDYERALQLQPRMASSLHNKALTLLSLRRYDEALAAAEAAIQIAPNDPDNWRRKAEALKKLRRHSEARNAEKEEARLRAIYSYP